MVGRGTGQAAWPFVAAAVVIGATVAPAGFVGAAAAPCTAGPGESVRLAAIDEAGEMTLADGRVARLSAIDVPLPQRGAVRALLAALVGQPAMMRSLARAPDRWGRITAQFVVAGSAGSGAGEDAGLSHALVSAGLARVRPDDGVTSEGNCLKALLAAEAIARQQRRGLWASTELGLQQAADTGSLLKNTGEFAVFEGRVLSVGERAEKTYINFGRRWSDDTTVTIAKRAWRMMARSGLSAEILRGRWIRVRGVVESDRGPLVEVTDLNQIELIEADRVQ